MGADLYILKIYKDHCDFDYTLKSVRKGCFKDCYNDGSLLNFVRSNTTYTDLSWWSLRAKMEWFNQKRNMTIDGAREFLNMMLDVREQIYSKGSSLFLDCYDHEKQKQVREFLPSADAWEYQEWLECLIAFLELAIKKKSTIRWKV